MGSTGSKLRLPLVNIQILGVQKAGTSALAHFLSQHPDICLVEGKEAHVFDQPDYASQTDSLAFAEKRYGRKLAHYGGEKYICDATPITLFNPTYLKRCVSYNPDAKFIVLLRDPVERALSHFAMSASRGREHRNILWSFVMEPFRLIKEKEEDCWPTGSPWRDCSYLKRGEYARQLKRLKALVPEDQILVLRQEALLSEHETTLQCVFEFLGLDPFHIEQKSIFKLPNTRKDLLQTLAGLYARLYFSVKG